MAGRVGQIREDWKKIQADLQKHAIDKQIDLSVKRKEVRERILNGIPISANDELQALLKKEYELEKEEDRLLISAELIQQGLSPDSEEYLHTYNLRMIRNNLTMYGEQEIEEHRAGLKEQIVLNKPNYEMDALGGFLKREYQEERELKKIELEKTYLERGYEKDSSLLKKTIELELLHQDMEQLNQDTLQAVKTELHQKWKGGEFPEIEAGSYEAFIHREYQLEEDLQAIEKARKEKELQEKLQKEEMNRKAEEAAREEAENMAKAINPQKKEKRGLAKWITSLFGRKPKEEVKKEVQKETPEKKKEEVKKETPKEKKEEVKKETPKEKKEEIKKEIPEAVKDEIQDETLEEEKKETIGNESVKETSGEKPMTVTEFNRREKARKEEEERQHKYRVEFAGKELPEAIRDCGDPKRLAEYLKKATTLSKDAREHLENKIMANAKIQSYEASRTMKQKNRPPAVKYKDGTILLKNKKRDVPKQTTMNGCWSAVMSDMLAHFGVNLSQEEIRAYRPEVHDANRNKNSMQAAMDRMNKDAMNEINDMADLIQRTVPNVAHHHMSLGADNPQNKELFKNTVQDALLNKNSPVAVLYGNHYLSIVGIKGNVLIVQNPDPSYDTKYQKLSIADLFEESKEGISNGQVTIDWLEDLKFEKNGTCKNITDQWKNMGVSCTDREFKAGDEKNYFMHVKGNEYYDTSRIADGVEETIYLPKMSFGKEKSVEFHDLEAQNQIIEAGKNLQKNETELEPVIQ